MAHTHGAVRMSYHGTYVGFFFVTDCPMADSISCNSSRVMRGWDAGVSKMIKNQNTDHNKPMPPRKEKEKKKKPEGKIYY